MPRSHKGLRTLGRGRVLIAFSFAPNGTSAIAQTSNRGAGVASVARTSQGLYTLTLNDEWSQLDFIGATVQLASAAARNTQIGVVSLSSKTAQVRIIDESGAVQDIAANANNRINVVLVVRHGSSD